MTWLRIYINILLLSASAIEVRWRLFIIYFFVIYILHNYSIKILFKINKEKEKNADCSLIVLDDVTSDFDIKR